MVISMDSVEESAAKDKSGEEGHGFRVMTIASLCPATSFSELPN